MATSEIIGLEFTDGSVWYCSRSTLANANGSYFAARFGTDAMIPAGAERTDSLGRTVYFIDGEGELFGKHILRYLTRNKPGKLPPFAKDPDLWRMLREEALFYCLDGLSSILNATQTFSPETNGDQGVLYWLGTKKGTQEYENPYSIGAVDVTGWVDMKRADFEAIGEAYPDVETSVKKKATIPKSRAALVAYRPPVRGKYVGGERRVPFTLS